MVLHKEQERIYRELMKKISNARSPVSHEHTQHDNSELHSLHGNADALNREREQTIRTLIDRVIELEEINKALVDGKAPETAELEDSSGPREQDLSVQDLQQRLHDITEKEEVLARENLQLANDLTAEQQRRTETEHQLGVFRQEMADRETAFVAEKENLEEDRKARQEKFDALTGFLDAERQKSTSLGSEIQGLNTTLRQHEEDVRTLRQRLEDANIAAEKNLHEIVSAKDKELQELRSAYARLSGELNAQKIALDLVLQEQGVTESTRKNLEGELAAAVLGRAESGTEARVIPGGQDPPIEELGYKDGLLRSLGNRAAIHRDRGELDRAMKFHKEEERICRKTGNQDGLQRSLGNQALILRDQGEPDLAMKLHKEEERICRETGNRDGLQRSLGNQAVIHRDRGEFDRAMKLHTEKERICREIGNKKGIVISLVNQAGIFVYEQRDPAAALPLLEEAYQIAVSSGFEGLVSQLRVHLDKVRKMNAKRSR